MVTLSFLMFIMLIIKAVDRFVTTLFFPCNGSWSWFVNKIIPRLQYSSIFFLPLRFFGTVHRYDTYCVSKEICPFSMLP